MTLDCISLDLKTGKYYYDLPKEELEQLAVEDGVLAFFEKIKKYGFVKMENGMELIG